MYQGDQGSLDEAPQQQPPEESSNRTFLIVAGSLAGLILLTIACLAGIWLFVIQPKNATTQQASAAQATQNAQVQQALTATAGAVSLATETPAPTDTPVLAEVTSTPVTPIITDTPQAVTATVGAALTQAAIAQLTVVATSTALPKTGIADQYGAPGLVLAAMVFIAVIFLARRLRVTPTK